MKLDRRSDHDDRITDRAITDLKLHPAVQQLGADIEEFSRELDIPLDELAPVVNRVLPVLFNDTVIGNWPAFREAGLNNFARVEVQLHDRLGFEDETWEALQP